MKNGSATVFFKGLLLFSLFSAQTGMAQENDVKNVTPEIRAPSHCQWTDKSLFEYGNLVGNAGCVVFHQKKLLVVRVRYKKNLFDIPAGTREASERAICTAGRETFEETGQDVIVHELIRNFDNKFYVFRCQLKNEDIDVTKPLSPSPGFTGEISQVSWIDVGQTTEQDWRFPKQLGLLKSLAESLAAQK
jgi:8-oxo-dGTP diphosphatase